jgi:hypothetical protein
MLGQVELEKPFLWGPVRTALVQEAKEHGPETLLRLCHSEEIRVKDMMVSVLTELGRDKTQMVDRILEELLPESAEPSRLVKALRLVHRADGRTDTGAEAYGAIDIAVQVASSTANETVLQRAALHNNPSIRASAVRWIYHLWEHDRDSGFQIVEYLSKRVVQGFVPNVLALESFVGVSLIMFFDHTRDPEVRQRLQAAWRRVIGGILRINESGSRAGNAFRGLIRNQLIDVALRFMLRTMREIPMNPINYLDLEECFRKPAQEKELYKRLTGYLDRTRVGDMKEWERDCRAALRTHNILIQSVVVLGLNTRMRHAPLEVLPFFKSLFHEAAFEVGPNAYVNALPVVLMYVLDFEPNLDPVFDYLLYTINICQEYYTPLKHQHHPGSHAIIYGPEATFISTYVLHQYRRSGTVHTEWLESRIQSALHRNDMEFFKFMVDVEMQIVGYELRKPRAALAALSIFFDKVNQPEGEFDELRQIVQRYLAKLRILYPDEVDDFLEEQKARQEIVLYVRTHLPVETIGEMIGTRSYNFIMEMIEDYPDLRHQVIEVLAKAADCKDARTWITYVLRQVLNWVYGGEALRLRN